MRRRSGRYGRQTRHAEQVTLELSPTLSVADTVALETNRHGLDLSLALIVHFKTHENKLARNEASLILS